VSLSGRLTNRFGTALALADAAAVAAVLDLVWIKF